MAVGVEVGVDVGVAVGVEVGVDVGVNVGVGVGVGPPVTVKLVALVPVPEGVVTPIGPLVAPAGTVAAIWMSELTVKAAEVPLKVTDVAPVKLEPAIVTPVPIGPLVGVKPVITGADVFVVITARRPLPSYVYVFPSPAARELRVE